MEYEAALAASYAHYKNGQWYPIPNFGKAIYNGWVEAWMPLPERYKG